MNKLVLFDIDQTLIKNSKGHSAAFSQAFKIVYDIDTTIDIINGQGMTDQQIIIEVLKKNGLAEQAIKSKLHKCMKIMVESFNKMVDKDEIMVLSGAQELLEELNKHRVLMGLVTGNLEPIARKKLKKVGLNHYFKVGGFGSDDINRTNLVKLAIKKAGKKFDLKFNNNIFLVGDTPQDMIAGKEAKVKTVGVATGIYSKRQLENAGADFILENLRDINKVLRIVL
ncbi:MAG: HAD family hydrolase [Patescibacteria group bacterium]